MCILELRYKECNLRLSVFREFPVVVQPVILYQICNGRKDAFCGIKFTDCISNILKLCVSERVVYILYLVCGADEFLLCGCKFLFPFLCPLVGKLSPVISVNSTFIQQIKHRL